MAKHKRGWLHELGQETARASTLGWDLALPIFIGVLLGYYLDRQLGTIILFSVLLSMAGFGGGVFLVYRWVNTTVKKRLTEMKKEE